MDVPKSAGLRMRDADRRTRDGLELVAQVQIERTAQKDVQHLHTAADAEHRQVVRVSIGEHEPLDGVAAGREERELLVLGVLTILGRVYVVAAGEQKAVHQGQDRAKVLDVIDEREHDGGAAHRGDGVLVASGHVERAIVRPKRGHDADQGAMPYLLHLLLLALHGPSPSEFPRAVGV